MIKDDNFIDILTKKQFRKNTNFKTNPQNMKNILIYLIQMQQLNETHLNLIQSVIKQWKMLIIFSLQPFYKKLQSRKDQLQKYKQKFQRIATLVTYACKPCAKCPQLSFVDICGTINSKGFTLRANTQKQTQCIKYIEILQNIKRLLSQINKDKIPSAEELIAFIQQINKIPQIVQHHKNNTFGIFGSYYLERMIRIIKNVSIKLGAIMKEKKQNKQEWGYQQVKNLAKILEKFEKLYNFQDKIKEDKKQQAKKKVQKSQKNQKPTKTQKTQKKNQQINTTNQKKVNQQTIVLKKQQTKKDNQTADLIKNITQRLKQYQISQSFAPSFSFGSGPNFSKIHLCCRTFFFDQQRIVYYQDIRTQFKSYVFPFTSPSIQTLKKTICSFLNTLGGTIYIGIKQTTSKKYRYALGNYLTENDKQIMQKSIPQIMKNIYPKLPQNAIRIQFVPIRTTPFRKISMKQQMQQYLYDFTQHQNFDPTKYAYRPGRYITRIRIPKGNHLQLYSYIQTQTSLHKKLISNEFTPFRGENEVYVNEPSQEVLRKYKERILFGNNQEIKVHEGACPEPEKGHPRNQKQANEEKNDEKFIQAQMEDAKIASSLLVPGNRSIIYDDKHYSSFMPDFIKKKQVHIQKQKAQSEKIFQYPLDFIAYKIQQKKIRQIISESSMKNHLQIHVKQNILTEQSQYILISLNSYASMSRFLRLKQKIQKYLAVDGTKLIGVTKRFRITTVDSRKITINMLTNMQSKYSFKNNQNLIQFYSIFDATSYYLTMKFMGFQMEIIL